MKLRNVNYRGRLAILTGAFCCTSLPMAALPTSVEAASPNEGKRFGSGRIDW